MKVLFKNAAVYLGAGNVLEHSCLETADGKIAYIGGQREGQYDRIIDGNGRLLIPALYNTHTHLPMTILKGYAEDMPLMDWLHKRIFPAEDKLNAEAVYWSTLLGIAELVRNGVVSCTDMYDFCDTIAGAVDESGFKCNISRAVMSFDPDEKPADNPRMKQACELFKNYHNASGGRIKIDMSIHAEYTSHPSTVRAVRDFAVENGARVHVHVSETKTEHEGSIERRGLTPTAYLHSLGLFDAPTTAAHCVHVTDEDMDILAARGVSVAHNPSSNLKLASGVARVAQMKKHGINVSIGTDGSASGNNMDILKELYLASVLQKGVYGDPQDMPACDMLSMATINSARSQGREGGELRVGAPADIVMLDTSGIAATPLYDYDSALIYSLQSRDVLMTMCEGRILYDNGSFETIDIKRVKHEVNTISQRLYK
ncbi:MAG: amidohydrolase family protein [Eubacteriales bacterium]